MNRITNRTLATFTVFLFSGLAVLAQSKAKKTNVPVSATSGFVSKVWVSGLGNGMYKNPVVNADYSDPDPNRVEDNYYPIPSSFEDIPGLPVLHSKDMINW